MSSRELRESVWPYFEIVMNSKSPKAIADTAATIIDLVEQDMANRLLSDAVKTKAAHHMQELAAQDVWDNRVHAHEAMLVSLAAIGIDTGEDDEQ